MCNGDQAKQETFVMQKQITMTHTYQISGMTCEGCKATVNHLLSKVSGVKNVNIDLTRGEATIEMEGHIRTSVLAGALMEYPKYKLSEPNHQQSERNLVLEDVTKTSMQTYKPLLIVFVYITLISLLVSLHVGRIMGMHWMNNFMASFFIVFSFFKMLDLKGFADSYSMYDVVAKRVKAYGFAYPFIELALGVAYLTGFNTVFTNWSTVIVMGVSLTGVIQSVLTKREIQCACLGAVFNLPMSSVTIIEDLAMILMAATMLVLL